MKRRSFLAGAMGGMIAPWAMGQSPAGARLVRPDPSTDEGGLWAIMDREEGKLRRSPFILHDEALHDYIQGIACRLAGDHCADVRLHLVRNRAFNASMAPNGMMQVWSGLMLRVDNEAQLAAVLGHEIGHYLERHSIASMRDIKSRSAVASVLSVFGLVGALGGVAAVAGAYGYSRDNERQADEIGLQLMSRAGYDPSEAARVWENLLLEARADPNKPDGKAGGMFATHPPIEERKENLTRIAAGLPKGETNEAQWLQMTAKYRLEWLNEECKRGRFAESMVLLNRLVARNPGMAVYQYARAEIHRLRGNDGDLDIAMKDYQGAQAVSGEPAETHRGLGLIYRQRQQWELAKASFTQYLRMAPDASDVMFIKSYIEEMKA